MRRPLKLRRYLVHFSSHNLPQVFTDVLVIGSGVAGISAALEAVSAGSVLVVTKAGVRDGCTNQAQGGIAGTSAPRSDIQRWMPLGQTTKVRSTQSWPARQEGVSALPVWRSTLARTW